jgi:CheY-like chemotaxis protein
MHKLKVLLAEDNRGDVLLVREALAEHGIPVDLFVMRDGGEALDYISGIGELDRTPCPDLVLLDLNLPKVDGLDILAEFRKHPQCMHTPVIVISSSDAPKDRERAGALGVTRYFRKPSDLDEFLKLGGVVREVIDAVPAA